MGMAEGATGMTQALQFLQALDPSGVYDFRAFHDRERGREGIAMRGTFEQCEPRLRELNTQLYGVHVMINETDGQGRRIENVTRCRAQLTDLDKGDIAANYARIIAARPLPHAVVNTSPGKYQVWHFTVPHSDRQLFTDTQRRLASHYDGDEQFIDVAHTARLPGFYHHKAAPYLVTLYSGPAWGAARHDPWAVAAPLMHIPVSGGSSERRPLGEPSMQAPTLDWAIYCLWRIDPNSLGFLDWIAITAAFKQATWSYGEATARGIWEQWCAYHRSNDVSENSKQWNHINATQSGWKYLLRSSGCEGEFMAAGIPTFTAGVSLQSAQSQARTMPLRVAAETVSSVSEPVATLGSYLTPAEQAQYFAGCYWVESLGRILTPRGRLMDQNKFNGTYNGKTFQTSDLSEAKTTKSAWEAATSGLSWRLPKVDHLRFLPQEPFGTIIPDELGREGVNTYRPIISRHEPGDVTPWLDHLSRVLPVARDRDIINSYMAFNAQKPGVQIGWAPVIQSLEGAGKTAFQRIMQAMVGRVYLHSPKAEDLVEGGGKFNAWIRNKLVIVVNELRVGANDKRDLVEILKPLITDDYIETQSKGIDQEMFDNCTNWIMFTNYQDAIPINANSRRFCVMYSALQSVDDLRNAGMDGDYFNRLYAWLRNGGASAVVEWLQRYPIPDEFNPARYATRAPQSSSHAEVLEASRTPIEQHIMAAVEGGLQGFRGGWLSSIALSNFLHEQSVRVPGPRTIAKALENLGYHKIGKSTRPYFQEGGKLQTYLYHIERTANMENYGKLQGYEI